MKHVGPNLESDDGYFWDEMAFLASWLPPHQATIVCLNTKPAFQDALRTVLWGEQIPRPETSHSSVNTLLNTAPTAGQDRAPSPVLPHGSLVESRRFDPRDPYALQSIIIEQVLALHDQSIWGIRNLVRRVEKV